jgi:hypothetical protein
METADRADCRLEVALSDAVSQFEDRAVEPGDLQPAEFLGRGDPAPAQFVAQDFFGSLPGDLFLKGRSRRSRPRR